MKSKKFETILYSGLGIVVMFAIVVAVNIITDTFRARVDLTEDNLNTLSSGTKAILGELDTPVEIRFYWSESQTRAPSQYRNYARHVEDLLREYEESAKGMIEIKKFDPQPDSDAEDLANLDGVEPRMVGTGDPVYLGLAISQDPQKVALPFLSPERERLLEYDITRALARVVSTNRPVVGVMSALPVFGQQMNPMMRQMGQRPQDPWIFITELKRDFDVREVPMTAETIDDDIKVLLVMHPKEITDKTQFAIDQFVLRGGRLIAFLDALSLSDTSNQNQMMGMMPGGGSSLDKLLGAWGIEFENDKVAADRTFTRQLQGRDGQPQLVPGVLFLNTTGINSDDAVMSQVDNILLAFGGVFKGTPPKDIKETVLLHTTKDSEMVDGMTAQFSGGKIMDEFKPDEKEYKLAIRLNGKFKTAFPDGKPGEEADKDQTKKEEAESGSEEKKNEGGDYLKESTGDSVVVLVGDTDFINDQFCVRVNPIFRFAEPINGNLNFAQSLVEQLAGDDRLIGARSRASLRRPFTVVDEMEASAQRHYQEEIQKLLAEQQETERRLSELQQQKEGGNQQFILSPEQQAEIAKFRERNAEISQNLKEVRRNLRKEVDSLENRLKWLNIAGMPIVVTLAGIGLAIVRKQRTKAQ